MSTNDGQNKLLGLGNKLKKLFSRSKTKKKGDAVRESDNSSDIVITLPDVQSIEKYENIIENDKDLSIRTACKECLFDEPKFPSRDEVKRRIEEAHKYYGVKCVLKHENNENQANWYYILERPLVEQYVLMNNYIRKLSVLSALKKSSQDDSSIEEEVSSASSLSDYLDFDEDSKLVDKIKINKHLEKHSLNQPIGTLVSGYKMSPIKSSIVTDDFDMIIREPQSSNESVRSDNTNETEQSLCLQSSIKTKSYSGDHLPDMNDFDLSYNLTKGSVDWQKTNGYTSYYKWAGNDVPTKTPLINLDSSPPIRSRPIGSAKDFMSFRNLTLSSEFIDSLKQTKRARHEIDVQQFNCATEIAKSGDVILTIGEDNRPNDENFLVLQEETEYPLTDCADEDDASGTLAGIHLDSDSSCLTFVNSKVGDVTQ